jgi:hypothetical protein
MTLSKPDRGTGAARTAGEGIGGLAQQKSWFVAAITGVFAAGCGGTAQPAGREPAGQTELRSEKDADASLILHVVAPKATDPAIDRALDDHYAWFNPASRGKHRLFVFLPGTNQHPAIFQLVAKEAARLGYHSIGLMYPNNIALNGACRATADAASCLENARLEILDGIDRTSVLNVDAANSIENRLTKLLQYLTVQFREEGWSRFMAHDGPRWRRIAVSGHSQGGGEAAMIAKLHRVTRVVLFSSPGDVVGGAAAPWLSGHVTPSDRYYGLAHDRDMTAPYASVLKTWEALGMRAFGGLIAPESSAPPYHGTHTLVTDLLPRGGSYAGTAPHGAPSNDLNTPLLSDGTPALREAWRYLLTANDELAEDDEHG